MRGARHDISLSPDDVEAGARALDPADARPLADDVYADLERAQAIRSALAEMPDRCRLLLEAFLHEESPNYKEIARRLEMPIGSIGPTRARCLARLRDLLAARGVTGRER